MTLALRLACLTLVGLVAGRGVLASPASAQAPSSQVPFTYTADQASRGQAAYATQCASCHGEHLDDGAFGPALKGRDFRERWGPETVGALFTYTSTKMPPAGPGRLDAPTYAALLAYLIKENGTQPGSNSLPDDPRALSAMMVPGWPRGGGGGLAPGVAVPPAPAKPNPLDTIRPVTERLLTQPGDGDWLLWRRTYNAFGFSPLRQINRASVGKLRLSWTWSLPPGPNESTPIVHDGVLFVHGHGDRVQALDASTGDLLWQYSRRLPPDVVASHKRSLSIYGTRLYVPTSDAHIVALDVKTGQVIWDRAVADPKAGYRMTGGPLVARGKVMIGTTGRAEGGNYIAALDAETGGEAWRFYTVARPGEPGGSSWNGLALEKRNGGSVWIPGSYDPVQNLAFFAPGNTYDTGPLRIRANQEGTTNDALYLDSTLALDPDTGKLAWHFQHQKNGQWDLDWAFERQVMPLRINGDERSVVVTVGKQSIFDVVDTETGRYLSSIDLGLQNVVKSIDPKTGDKQVDPALIPGDGLTKMVCPHVSGGRGWLPTAYNPLSKVLYMSITEACMDMVPVPEGERGSLSSGVRWTVRPPPQSDGKYGRLQALDMQTGKTAWVARQRAPLTSGTLVTAGGLVFAGSLDRMFMAYDAATGVVLWKARLNDVPSAPPIAFSAGGREYVAVIVGPGGYQSTSYSALVPEIQNPPDRSAALWVFELP